MSASFLARIATYTRTLQAQRSSGAWGIEQLAVCMLLGLALASLAAAIRSGAMLPLLFGVQELMLVVLVCVQHPNCAPERGTCEHLRAAVLAWGGMALPLLLRPGIAAPATIVAIGGVLQLSGSLLALVATLTLGRRFGIVAAHRGVQTRGLYRIVRHPIYLAYLLTNSGFVLAEPHWGNIAVLVVWIVVQARRAIVEERVLMRDAVYQDYSRRVRYRFVPGIW